MVWTYTEGGAERFWFDAVSAVVLFMTAIGGAWLPKYLCSHDQMSSRHSLAFHLGNMLSAGVMLSAGFCHLLADAHRNLLFIGRFPISNFLAATGYIITLLADQVVQFVSEQQQAAAASASAKSDDSTDGHDNRKTSPCAAICLPPVLRNGGYKPLPSSNSGELTVLTANGGPGLLTTVVHRESGHIHHLNHHNHLHTQHSGAGSGATGRGSAPQLDTERGLISASSCPAPVNEHPSSKAPQSSGAGPSGSPPPDSHSSGMAVLLGGGRKLSFATAVLLASALCIHSILEGMALGAQRSMRSTEDIMVAIAAHKGLAAYALGASIMESGASSRRFWTVIGCFSLATPIGIFAGYGMSAAKSSKSGSALSALASGTFLYVAFMEVIPKELADTRHRGAKMVAFLVGYALMSLLAVWA